MCVCVCARFPLRFIYLLEGWSYRKLEAKAEKVLHLLVHSLCGCNGSGQPGSEPGARNFGRLSDVGTGAQVLGPFSAVFQAPQQGHGLEVEQLDLNSVE